MLTLAPAFEEIGAGATALSEFGEKPAGTIRISTSAHAAQAVPWPALRRLLPDYPDVKVELDVDNGLTNIVAERYNAGVGLGEQVEEDMIAVRIGQACAWRWSGRRGISQSSRSQRSQRSQRSRNSSSITPASICARRTSAASMRGSSRKVGAR